MSPCRDTDNRALKIFNKLIFAELCRQMPMTPVDCNLTSELVFGVESSFFFEKLRSGISQFLSFWKITIPFNYRTKCQVPSVQELFLTDSAIINKSTCYVNPSYFEHHAIYHSFGVLNGGQLWQHSVLFMETFLLSA